MDLISMLKEAATRQSSKDQELFINFVIYQFPHIDQKESKRQL